MASSAIDGLILFTPRELRTWRPRPTNPSSTRDRDFRRIFWTSANLISSCRINLLKVCNSWAEVENSRLRDGTTPEWVSNSRILNISLSKGLKGRSGGLAKQVPRLPNPEIAWPITDLEDNSNLLWQVSSCILVQSPSF